MRPARGAVTIDLLLWIAGTMIAIVFFIGIVWPWLLSIWYGSCWADARTDLRDLGSEIEGAIRSPNSPPIEYSLTIGDCIKGIVFINGKDNPDYYKILNKECSQYSGYKSYMIAIPIKPDPEYETEGIAEKSKDWQETLSAWDKIKLWLKEKMGRNLPEYCYEFEHAFSPSGINSIPAGYTDPMKNDFNSGTNTYCLHISPEHTAVDSDYNYRILEVPCPAVEKGE